MLLGEDCKFGFILADSHFEFPVFLVIVLLLLAELKLHLVDFLDFVPDFFVADAVGGTPRFRVVYLVVNIPDYILQTSDFFIEERVVERVVSYVKRVVLFLRRVMSVMRSKRWAIE